MPSKSKSLKSLKNRKPEPKPRHFLMVAIDPKLRGKFAKHAAKQDMSMSAIIRDLVERAVNP